MQLAQIAFTCLYMNLAPEMSWASAPGQDATYPSVLGVPGQPPLEVVAPLPAAHCDAHIVDVGVDKWVPTETDYLPHVVQCENGGANLEALKAQAIAARSVLYYAMETNGEICDSQGCQVYSCNATPNALQKQAVEETAGIYLMYNDTLTYGFYVAGDPGVQPPQCVGNDNNAGTEKFVTYNEGKSGTDVTQTTLGFIFDPNDFGYGQNRGCMGQWAARCLENNNGYTYEDILKFFYGDDIILVTAPGECVPEANTKPVGSLDGVNCDVIEGWAQDPDAPDTPIDVHLYFDGPAGDPDAFSLALTADEYRDDLCQQLMSCEHGFSLLSPLSLHDGQLHPIYAYGIDTEGGQNPQLSASPIELTCAPTIPEGVRRHVTSPESFASWAFSDFWSMLPLSSEEVLAIEQGLDLPAEPWLVRGDGDTTVWLIDSGVRRHVPGPNAMENWGFDWDAIEIWPLEQVEEVPTGPKVRTRPVTVRDDLSGAVYLIDDAWMEDEPTTTGSDTTDPTTTTTTGEDTGTTVDVTDGPELTTTSAEPSTTGDTTGALPPDYSESASTGAEGEGGCGCSSNQNVPPYGFALLVLAGTLVRRRRRA